MDTDESRQFDLSEIMWAQAFAATSTIVFHSLLYMRVITSNDWFWVYIVLHGVVLLAYVAVLLMWSKGKIDCASFSAYYTYVSAETIEDYFYTFGTVSVGHVVFLAYAIAIYNSEAFDSYLPTFGIGGALLGIYIFGTMKKPIRLRKVEDKERQSVHVEETKKKSDILRGPPPRKNTGAATTKQK